MIDIYTGVPCSQILIDTHYHSGISYWMLAVLVRCTAAQLLLSDKENGEQIKFTDKKKAYNKTLNLNMFVLEGKITNKYTNPNQNRQTTE